MVVLPRFLRKLKFKSKFDLIAMTCLCVDGFIRDDDDYDEDNDWDDDKHSSYKEFIFSRYVNIFPSHIGLTGESPDFIGECVFRFKLGSIPESAYLLSDHTTYFAYSEFRSGLRKFLTTNLPSFNSLPEE